ncbi:hypothetical protein [Rhodococcus sp. 27YEA15]|uniref:glycine-rich domain-containing protein n=1 Tax=Rhodococcus sp. 27YEA15 TaxID=3156259 RepID=UPI003C7D5D32
MQTEEEAKARITNGAMGRWQGAQNSHRLNVRMPLEQQLAIITNHEARITAAEEAVRQSILQGEAVRFDGHSGWWRPPQDLIYAELIGVAAGAGGAAGSWNLAPGGQRGGSGGGGGGQRNLSGITRIYADLLPKTGDDYDWIYVTIYAAGNGGTGSGGAGSAGGNIVFGSNLAQPLVVFEGGFGAAVGDTIPAVSGKGGSGMVPGGDGGYGSQTPQSNGAGGTNGESSISPYDFLGGGGGGGGGGCANRSNAGTGGAGVATTGGGPGQPGVSPNPIIAAGASGGGGARNAGESGGAGGFPGGGGGGGFGGGLNSFSSGGKGGEARLWVIETRRAAT